jgi:phage-related minor tail protein
MTNISPSKPLRQEFWSWQKLAKKAWPCRDDGRMDPGPENAAGRYQWLNDIAARVLEAYEALDEKWQSELTREAVAHAASDAVHNEERGFHNSCEQLEKMAAREERRKAREASKAPRKHVSLAKALDRLQDLLEEANELAQELLDNEESDFDERSEKWQESEGEEAQCRIEALREVIEYVENAIARSEDCAV